MKNKSAKTVVSAQVSKTVTVTTDIKLDNIKLMDSQYIVVNLYDPENKVCGFLTIMLEDGT